MKQLLPRPKNRVPGGRRATSPYKKPWKDCNRVDVPVVLPRDDFAGLPNLKGWLADPKYLKWTRAGGIRIGLLELIKGRRSLHFSYGLAGFDGCGGRDLAIETNVLGQPALLYQGPLGGYGVGSIQAKHLWSHVIWPVTDTGSTAG